ncbi:hypothetical protein BDF21DRAFT_395668 [Thamnidium elegans]|nr:hypothetical protein BDF21DRAFT_395668 [Thamnidium elegans]
MSSEWSKDIERIKIIVIYNIISKYILATSVNTVTISANPRSSFSLHEVECQDVNKIIYWIISLSIIDPADDLFNVCGLDPGRSQVFQAAFNDLRRISTKRCGVSGILWKGQQNRQKSGDLIVVRVDEFRTSRICHSCKSPSLVKVGPHRHAIHACKKPQNSMAA